MASICADLITRRYQAMKEVYQTEGQGIDPVLGMNFSQRPSSTAKVNATICRSSTPSCPPILVASSTVKRPRSVPIIVAACTRACILKSPAWRRNGGLNGNLFIEFKGEALHGMIMIVCWPIATLKRAEDALQVEGHHATWHYHAAGVSDISSGRGLPLDCVATKCIYKMHYHAGICRLVGDYDLQPNASFLTRKKISFYDSGSFNRYEWR